MVQFPAGTREYSVLQNVQTGFGVHSASYSMGTKGFFPRGVKWLQGEVHCSPSSSAKVKNECSYITTPLHTICLHGLERENFTLY